MTLYTRAHLTALLQAATARYELADWSDAALWLNATRSLRDMLAVAK